MLITGLPGISIPPSQAAIRYRAGCDLMIVHSRRERREFSALAQTMAPGLRVALARLPFLIDAEPSAEPDGTVEAPQPARSSPVRRWCRRRPSSGG